MWGGELKCSTVLADVMHTEWRRCTYAILNVIYTAESSKGNDCGLRLQVCRGNVL